MIEKYSTLTYEEAERLANWIYVGVPGTAVSQELNDTLVKCRVGSGDGFIEVTTAWILDGQKRVMGWHEISAILTSKKA